MQMRKAIAEKREAATQADLHAAVNTTGASSAALD